MPAGSRRWRGRPGRCAWPPSPADGHNLLLDLPTDLLLVVLHDTPHALRSTCRLFRDVLDGLCRELHLCPTTRTHGPPRVAALTSLVQRLPGLRSLDSKHIYDPHSHPLLAFPHNFKTLAFLAPAAALVSLTITSSHIASHHLRTLSASCRSLTTLDLIACHHLLDIEPLSALPALSSLNLRYCFAVASIAPLASCPQLTSLDLQCACDRTVTLDVTPLSSCPSLQHLNLSLTTVASLLPLLACTQLRVLCIGSCSVSEEDTRRLRAVHGPQLRIEGSWSVAL